MLKKRHKISILAIILASFISKSVMAYDCNIRETRSCLCYFNDSKENGIGHQTCGYDNEYGPCMCKKNYAEYNWGISLVVIGSLSFVVGSAALSINHENNMHYPQTNSDVVMGVSIIPIVLGLVIIGVGSFLAIDGNKKVVNQYVPHQLSNNGFGWSF